METKANNDGNYKVTYVIDYKKRKTKWYIDKKAIQKDVDKLDAWSKEKKRVFYYMIEKR